MLLGHCPTGIWCIVSPVLAENTVIRPGPGFVGMRPLGPMSRWPRTDTRCGRLWTRLLTGGQHTQCEQLEEPRCSCYPTAAGGGAAGRP